MQLLQKSGNSASHVSHLFPLLQFVEKVKLCASTTGFSGNAEGAASGGGIPPVPCPSAFFGVLGWAFWDDGSAPAAAEGLEGIEGLALAVGSTWLQIPWLTS